MIYRSYFRKKKNIIYMIVLSVAVTVCLLLSSFVEYYKNLMDDIYSKRSIFIIESTNDSYKIISKNEYLDNVQRVIGFYPNKSYDVAGEKANVFMDASGNVISSSEATDGIDQKLKWNDLELGSYDGKILAGVSTDLRDNEISIGLPHGVYNSYKSNGIIDNSTNKRIGFIYEGQNFEFTIASFYSTKFPELKITKGLYSDLLKKEKSYIYKADVLSYTQSERLENNLESDENLQNTNVVLDSFYYNFESNVLIRANNIVTIINICIAVLILALIIFLCVVTKNQINDLEKNMILEYKVGYSKSKVKINTFKRLFLLFTLSFAGALLFLVVASFIINMFSDITLGYPNVKLLVGLYICVNLLVLIQVIKESKLKKRR